MISGDSFDCLLSETETRGFGGNFLAYCFISCNNEERLHCEGLGLLELGPSWLSQNATCCSVQPGYYCELLCTTIWKGVLLPYLV